MSRLTLFVVLGFLMLSILFTWPLATHLNTRVIGPFYGDNLEYVWKIWWFKHALVDLGQSPLIQPDIYYPYGYPLAYGEITPIHTVLGIPLTILLGPVTTYNLFILASFALSGLFTYLLVLDLTASKPAALVAGVVFAFCPYRLARSAGHLPLMDTQWVPLFLLMLERFLRHRHWRYAILAGLAFAAATLSSWYYGLALGLLAPVYTVARRVDWRSGTTREWLRGAALFTTTSAVAVTPFLLPYLEIQEAGAATVPLEQAAFWSAGFNDYLVPNPHHFWWGDWVQRNLTPFPGELPYEFVIGWGYVPTMLALYGWRRGRFSRRRAWGCWILVALILSLGPAVTLFGRVVTLPVPEAVSNVVNNGLDWIGRHSLAADPYSLASSGRVAIPLPALLLRWFVPGLAGMRSWGRLAVFATLGIAVLGGAAIAAFLRDEIETRPARNPNLRRWAWAGLFAALILFEYYPGVLPLITPSARPVDEWLAGLDEKVTIIQLPVSVALSGPQMYYTMHHNQRIASGYGTYFPILFDEWYPELNLFPSNDSLNAMASWGGAGVDYILLDERDVPADDARWTAIAAEPRLEPVIVLDRVHVFQLR